MQTTREQLLKIMPRAEDLVDAFIEPLNEAMERWEINTVDRCAAFLAQAARESTELTQLRENLNYSAEALRRVFPKYFTSDAMAQHYEHQPQMIANFVYAGRMGNGDVLSGDGWRNRGAGIFQLTGAKNIGDCSQAVCGNFLLLDSPDLLVTPQYATQSAGWFWHTNGLSAFADRAAFEEMTRRINGGLNGLKERVAYWHNAIEAYS
jgi:putative chitinase